MKSAVSYLYAIVPAVLIASCASQAPLQYTNPKAQLMTGNNSRALVLPVKSIKASYRDNTKSIPRADFSDSFLVEAVNSFIIFGLSNSFQVIPFVDTGAVDAGLIGSGPALSIPVDTASGDSSSVGSNASGSASIDSIPSVAPRHSVLYNDTGNLQAVSEYIKHLAASAKADIVIIPYECELHYFVFQPSGWRGKYNQSYAKPATHSAQTIVDLQIWSKDGVLLAERKGASDTGRPLLYSIFKQEKVKNDLVLYAKNIYAPPLIKSLYKAVTIALQGL